MSPGPSPLLSDQTHQCLRTELILLEGFFDLPGEGQLPDTSEDVCPWNLELQQKNKHDVKKYKRYYCLFKDIDIKIPMTTRKKHLS